MKYVLIMILSLISFNAAAEIKVIGRFKAWEAFHDTDKKICYIVGLPSFEPERSNVYVTLAMIDGKQQFTFTGHGQLEDVKHRGGFEKYVHLIVDGEQKNLRAYKNKAFVMYIPEKDISKMLFGGQELTLEMQINGEKKYEYFSLNGISRAWRKATRACDIAEIENRPAPIIFN